MRQKLKDGNFTYRCDCCNQFAGVTSSQTDNVAAILAKKYGWVIKSKKHLCKICASGECKQHPKVKDYCHKKVYICRGNPCAAKTELVERAENKLAPSKESEKVMNEVYGWLVNDKECLCDKCAKLQPPAKPEKPAKLPK